MEEIGQKPPGMVLEPCKKWDFNYQPQVVSLPDLFHQQYVFLTYGCFQK